MKLLVLALFGAFAAATPAYALETTAQAPVKITSCVVARDRSGNDEQARPANTDGVTAVIVNTSAKSIKDVQISGIYNGLTITDTVAGPFEAGQTYTLHKTHRPLAYDGPDAACMLNHVTFADGTVWQMPAPAATK